MAEETALIVFAHGARDPEWALPLRHLTELLAQRLAPATSVRLAFLEFMKPSLPDCIAELAESGVGQIVVFPAFLARGGHLKTDLPRLVNEAQITNPGVRIRILPSLGENEELLVAISDWLAVALDRR